MRIGIQTWGSHGDIRPFFALTKGLKESGHEVSLLVTSVDGVEYHDVAEELDIDIKHVPNPGFVGAEKLSAVWKLLVETSDSVKHMKTVFSELLLPAEKEMFRAAELLCQNNDLVIGHYLNYSLQIAAEKYSCRYIILNLAHNSGESSNVVHASDRFAQKAFKDNFTWSPSFELEQSIIKKSFE